MARATLTPPENRQEPKTYAEIRDIISETMSKIPGVGTVPPNSVSITYPEDDGRRWSASFSGHGITDQQVKLIESRDDLMRELREKYRIV